MTIREIKYFNIPAFPSHKCDELWIEMNREKESKIKFYSFDIKAEFDAVEENDIKVLANDPIDLFQ
jgi:hypothetical protein